MLRQRLQLLLALTSLIQTVSGQEFVNVTLDDTDPFIIYAPSTSWHASTVPCDSCLAPPNSTAFDLTWHDGTHIVPTSDNDDDPGDGDTSGEGDGTPVASTTLRVISPTQSQSNTQSPTATSDSDEDSEDGDDDDDDGHQKEKGKNPKRRSLVQQLSHKPVFRRDGDNPFETNGDDDDDPGFHDIPVTATISFTGSAIYVFAIVPLFPAPQLTTPTVMNLTFTLDDTPHGQFLSQPSAANSNTPTAQSPESEKYSPNFPVFTATGLNDTSHTLVINVGVDSVLLFDRAVITQNENDSASGITTAPGVQETGGTPQGTADTAKKHNVATFAGVVGGSVGFLSILALGLCISIRYRRRRAARRERRLAAGYAENFTASDHGNEEARRDDDDDEEQAVEGRNVVDLRNQPMMSQAAPAPFVPRYFPGSVPVSPPPYPDSENTPVVLNTHQQSLQLHLGALGVAIPLPPPMLDLHRTVSGGSSYAERPPPTPPGFEAGSQIFTELYLDDRSGGIVGPLPSGTPVAEETDPMIAIVLDSSASLQSQGRRMAASTNVSAASRNIAQSPTPSSSSSSRTEASSRLPPLSEFWHPPLLRPVSSKSSINSQFSSPQSNDNPSSNGAPVSMAWHMTLQPSFYEGQLTESHDRLSLRSFENDDGQHNNRT